jgi:hypothetical protein
VILFITKDSIYPALRSKNGIFFVDFGKFKNYLKSVSRLRWHKVRSFRTLAISGLLNGFTYYRFIDIYSKNGQLGGTR